VPDHPPLAEIAEVREQEAKAGTEAERIAAMHGAAGREVAKLRGAGETLNDQRETLAAQLEQQPDPVVLEALIKQVTDAVSLAEEARTAEETARDAVEQSKVRLAELDEADRRARRDYAGQRESVVALQPPAAEGHNVLDDWKALGEWAATRIPEQSKLAADASVEAERRAQEHRQTIAGFHRDMERVGVAVPDTPDLLALVSTMAAATTAAQNDVTRIEEAMGRAEKLRADRAALAEERDVARLLGKLLEADEFPQWVLQEAMAVLTVDASEILRQLTGGQFSLAFGETEFVVVDHTNADERRPARTLSGGETFQASLALALALADQLRTLAAEGAPRLDAIFLDEGFGTLDPETLDVVAATIENLGQSGRMVGIVTHVSELAARVPVRFKVSKGLGSSVVVKEHA
jgi:exonuclease SbcC